MVNNILPSYYIHKELSDIDIIWVFQDLGDVVRLLLINFCHDHKNKKLFRLYRRDNNGCIRFSFSSSSLILYPNDDCNK